MVNIINYWKKMDKCQKIEFLITKIILLIQKMSYSFLKEILQRKLTDFENDPSLLKKCSFW